jgi:hypothetical protein
MATDWQVGDLAVRVRTPEGFERRCVVGKPTPLGTVRRVDGIVSVHGEVGLIFTNDPSPHPTKAWASCQWRKVVKDKREACEPEFVTLLKNSKRKVSA